MNDSGQISLELGLDVLRSYKRLAYTPWHALAEFVDNSTQSYFDNRDQLDENFRERREDFEIRITLDRQTGFLRISDNAMGMSLEELRGALRVGHPPANRTGRSQYGMGMKTAASWYGDLWRVRTKKLGEHVEHEITVDVERVADGDSMLPYIERSVSDPEDHYTVIEIEQLHRTPHGRTIGKIRDFFRSMYRVDLRNGDLRLYWGDAELTWDDDEEFVTARDGSVYKKSFEFTVNDRRVYGWVGVLARGSRAKAGFAILRRGRVVRGWPDPWRPESVFGQIQGSNDLVNQRLTGEINLDDFVVSHTKDDIQWMMDEEDQVQEKLKETCADYRDVALKRRVGGGGESKPTDLEIQSAVQELQAELNSAEMVDLISIDVIPPPDVVTDTMRDVLEGIDKSSPELSAKLETPAGLIEILGFLADDMSPSDPYVVSESSTPMRVLVAINMQHGYLQRVSGSDSLLHYFRHCVYDAISEWQARNKAASIDPDTIKLLKDKLLRLPFEIEIHGDQA
jgi:hypothetical protein